MNAAIKKTERQVGGDIRQRDETLDEKAGRTRGRKVCRAAASVGVWLRNQIEGKKTLVELNSQLWVVDASQLLVRPEVAVKCAIASIRINKQVNRTRGSVLEETAV